MQIAESRNISLQKGYIFGITELLHKIQPKMMMESKPIPVNFVIARKQKLLQNLVMNTVFHKIIPLIVNIIGKNQVVNIQA